MKTIMCASYIAIGLHFARKIMRKTVNVKKNAPFMDMYRQFYPSGKSVDIAESVGSLNPWAERIEYHKPSLLLINY